LHLILVVNTTKEEVFCYLISSGLRLELIQCLDILEFEDVAREVFADISNYVLNLISVTDTLIEIGTVIRLPIENVKEKV